MKRIQPEALSYFNGKSARKGKVRVYVDTNTDQNTDPGQDGREEDGRSDQVAEVDGAKVVAEVEEESNEVVGIEIVDPPVSREKKEAVSEAAEGRGGTAGGGVDDRRSSTNETERTAFAQLSKNSEKQTRKEASEDESTGKKGRPTDPAKRAASRRQRPAVREVKSNMVAMRYRHPRLR